MNWHRTGRALLVLGRVSNLPTVWSNCLAGWLLGGGGPLGGLLWLTAGASLLYIGGMYLNDAFDVDFDRQHRGERPIPSGAISPWAVWLLGFGWILAGLGCLAWLGGGPAFWGLILALAILLYDAIHKAVTFSPVLMAACRFLLYILAASVAWQGITGLVLWSAFALASYIIGLSYIARKESAKGALRRWPALFLAAPVLLALIVNTGDYFWRAAFISLLLAAWIIRSLRFTLWSADRNIGRTVSGLLAGIVLVDWLAVANVPFFFMGLIFLLLFAAALLFQRFIPAT